MPASITKLLDIASTSPGQPIGLAIEPLVPELRALQADSVRSSRPPARACAKSVLDLLRLERMDCGGSKAAAAVLLTTYNFYNYRLDISDLCILDPQYFDAAMNVLRLRCNYGVEPHTVVENGGEIFEALAEDWKSLKS